jgi:hypothetical protein
VNALIDHLQLGLVEVVGLHGLAVLGLLRLNADANAAVEPRRYADNDSDETGNRVLDTITKFNRFPFALKCP